MCVGFAIHIYRLKRAHLHIDNDDYQEHFFFV